MSQEHNLMAEDFSSGSITRLKDEDSIPSVKPSGQGDADHVSLMIKQEEITLDKMKKTAYVDEISMFDGDFVRSVELAAIAANPNEFQSSLEINEDRDTTMYRNTGVVLGIKEKEVHDVGKVEHVLRSGPTGKCNDPFCASCPSVLSSSAELIRSASHYGRTVVYWGRRRMPGILNPHTKYLNQWNKLSCISLLVAIIVDSLFFFLLSVRQDDMCLVFDNGAAKAISVVRTLTDAIHACHIVLQFRLAYTISDSKVRRAGELEENPQKIALHYLQGWFILDLITALPLPQIVIWTMVKSMLGRPNGANDVKNVLRVVIPVQNIPRSIRILGSLLGKTPSGFVSDSAWSDFVVNFLMYLLAGHMIGACWYLFGLQRVNLCMQKSCENESSGFSIPYGEEAFCKAEFLDCGAESNSHPLFSNDQSYILWRNYTSVGTNCLVSPPNTPNFQYGVFLPGVPVVMEKSILNKYIYSLAWGFVQISSLAGNQLPSTFVGEALFTMFISALGLLLAAVLIGNIQSSLQNLKQRKMQMQLTRYETDAWMRQRRLPQSLRKRVEEASRFRWAATGGVKEQELIDNLPEDLQEDIQRFLYMDLIKRVPLFEHLDDHVLNAICERLSPKLYTESSEIFRFQKPVERILFIVRGKLESVGEDKSYVQLCEGDFCGEELLSWYINKNVLRTSRKSEFEGQHPLSSRSVRCLSRVETFSLESDGLEYVLTRYKAAFTTARVQGVMRYLSLDWRIRAATKIQTAWRASEGRRILNLERYWQTLAATRIQKAWRASKDRKATPRRLSKGPVRSLVLTLHASP